MHAKARTLRAEFCSMLEESDGNKIDGFFNHTTFTP
jgi:hypothetical protein